MAYVDGHVDGFFLFQLVENSLSY
ncbi:MAG: hypothetical protein KZQ89_09040 [Candidatus Thiodiazotropha sp. (ex Lucinoma kastoroae)]|nr:hypothetical protein [Candidatus Thiodiazotropha sp. (ex Lucinoma kastoroae)]